MVAEDDKDSCGGDKVVFGAPTADGGIPYVRHREDHSLSLGIARVVRDSEPIDPNTELVQVEPLEGPAYRVKTLYASKGPSKVNSRAYQTGWEQIFGNKTPVGDA